MSNCGCDLAFLPLFTDTPLPVPWERLRLTIVPGYGPGLASVPASPANSTPRPPSDAVNGPVWGAPVPESGTSCVPPAEADPPTMMATAAHNPSATSSRKDLLRILETPPIIDSAGRESGAGNPARLSPGEGRFHAPSD